jgi:integrase
MPKPRAAKLESATARLKLPVAGKPIWVALAPGISLGYRRNAGAGTWSVRSRGNGTGWIKRIGLADDYEVAAPPTVLTFWQAQDEARKLARQQPGAPVDESRPVTVGEALDRYKTYLKARGARLDNAQYPRTLLTAAMLDKPLQLISRGELERWRDSLVGTNRQAATVNRVVKGLMASFALAAKNDARVRAHLPELKIEALPAASRARNVVLTDDQVRAIIRAAYERDTQFGLFVDVLAVTGSRPVQVARLTVADLQDAPPRLMMPRSAKGGGKDRLARKNEHVAVPVTAALARRLRAAADGRPSHAPLLIQRTSAPWGEDPCVNYRPAVREVIASVGLDPDRVTLYALRHSAITRQLLTGTPIRIVAAVSDTSVAMIERHYAQDIASHSDEIFRRGLLQDEAPDTNVIPIRTKG